MTEKSTWHAPPHTPPRTINLFCIPGAGGSALMFRHWKTQLHPSVRLRPLELAGRGRRYEDRYYNDISDAVEDLYRLVEPHLEENNFAFFGHSMGALLCYELIGAIWSRRNLAPIHAFIAGRVPPNNTEIKMLYQKPDAQLLKEIMHWNILSSQQLKDKVLVRMFLTILREDMKIVEMYTLQSRAYHRLPCPISILTGAKDTAAPAWKMPDWEDFTTRSCSFHTFPGGHGFIADCQDKVIDLINTTLSSTHPN